MEEEDKLSAHDEAIVKKLFTGTFIGVIKLAAKTNADTFTVLLAVSHVLRALLAKGARSLESHNILVKDLIGSFEITDEAELARLAGLARDLFTLAGVAAKEKEAEDRLPPLPESVTSLLH